MTAGSFAFIYREIKDSRLTQRGEMRELKTEIAQRLDRVESKLDAFILKTVEMYSGEDRDKVVRR